MDVITFEIGDTIIQLVGGDALFWTNGTGHEPDVVVQIDQLQKVLGTAHMLRSMTPNIQSEGRGPKEQK